MPWKFVYIIFLTIFNFFCDFLTVTELFLDRSLPEHSSYDYIIVGSGSAGSNLHGLKGKVLLIEAGGYGSSLIFNIPIIQPLLLRSNYDNKHETISQINACKALNSRKSFWPSGKILAGSTRLNNMIYHRCHYTDYEDILSKSEAEFFFKQVEEEVPVKETYFKSKLSHAFINASLELGFNDFGYTNLTHKHGRRISQFYNHWNKKPEICLNAVVTRIIFDQENSKRAVGVEFIKNDQVHRVQGKNVVLAAGTMGSPKILMLSGIGPREHLKNVGIDVIEDLPVGENLQDHVTTFIDLLLNQSIDTSVADVFNPINVIKYLWNGKDTIYSLAGSDAMGFISLNENQSVPDLSFILIPVGITFDYGLHLRKVVNLREDVWKDYYENLVGQTSATILPVLLHPKSVGKIQLTSKNFKDPLIIDPNYLAIKDDVDKLIKGIRIIQKLLETSSMRQFNAELIPKSLPNCDGHVFDSNGYWECYVRHMTFTMYHPVSTCKLGDLNDSRTVVLKNFQVKNIENLYVVDASILPRLPSANPHSIVSMLAQKFSHDMNLLHNDDI